MRWLAALWNRLRGNPGLGNPGLGNRGLGNRDIDEELRFHVDQLTEDNIRAGLDPAEARRQALVALGGVQQTREAYGDQIRAARFVEQVVQDVRYGLRQLRRSPGFVAVAVLSLALGIGANTALFSVVDALLLKNIPVKEPGRLVLFESRAPKDFKYGAYSGSGYTDPDTGEKVATSFPYQAFTRLRQDPGPLAGITAFFPNFRANASVDGRAEVVLAQLVSGNYHQVLGIQPRAGRLLQDEDDRANATPVAVLSHRYWERRFGSDPGAIGKQINVNKVALTVVGVTPPGFDGTGQAGSSPELTVPLALEPQLNPERSRLKGAGFWWLRMIGRLKDGVAPEQARAQLEPAFQQAAVEHREARRANAQAQGDRPAPALEPKDYPRLALVPGGQGELDTRRQYAPQLYLLLGAVGLVLLIACANVANLLLARATARQKEIAMRLAIGAGRFRLIRQFWTESMLLAGAGGITGVLLALWIKDALLTVGDWGGEGMAALQIALDWRVLAVTIAVSLLTGLLFGTVPALRATRIEANPALKNTGSGSVFRSRLSKGLVVAQMAMSLVLLIGAGLILRTLHNLRQTDPGFNTRNLLLFTVAPDQSSYRGERLAGVYREMFEKLEAVPGARSVTSSSDWMLAYSSSSRSVYLAGQTFAIGPDNQPVASGGSRYMTVRENFLQAMEIPLLLGRPLQPQDNERAPKVAVVNQAFVRKFFPDGNALGKRFGFSAAKTNEVEIVGVARDSKYATLREEIQPNIYIPWAQQVPGGMTFAVRAAGRAEALITAVNAVVREIDPNLALSGVKTQVQQTAELLRTERFIARLLTFFALLALLLAAVGLYGVLAYSVEQRTQEVGIRRALGAQTADVLRLVVGQGMRLAAAGVALGAAAAFGLTRLLQSLLFGVEPTDPPTFVTVAFLLAAIALLACLLPARRAVKVDPLVALRAE